MAHSNAQRQAAYRLRHLRDTEGQGQRLNTIVSVTAKRTLERLADCHGVTQRVLLEHLLAEAERQVLQRVSGDEEAYYEGRLRVDISVTQ